MTAGGDLVLVSPHPPAKVMEIIAREVDPPPSILRSLLTLNAHYHAGTARVCGTVQRDRFELRNRRGPGFSLVARGVVAATPDGSELRIAFSKPPPPDIVGWLFDRYAVDRETILRFLTESLRARVAAQRPA